MGGAAAGEIASAMAVEIVIGEMRANWIMSETTDPDTFVAHDQASDEVGKRTHQFIRRVASGISRHGDHGDGGGVSRRHAVSRTGWRQPSVSRSQRASAQQITKDQSLMQKLIEAGELTEEEAAQSERRNIILQALGPEPSIKVDLTHQNVRRGDTLVLCSDGLSGQVTKDEIGVIVTESPSIEDACNRLVDRANESGGPDNITVIIARFDGPGLQASVSRRRSWTSRLSAPRLRPDAGRGVRGHLRGRSHGAVHGWCSSIARSSATRRADVQDAGAARSGSCRAGRYGLCPIDVPQGRSSRTRFCCCSSSPRRGSS